MSPLSTKLRRGMLGRISCGGTSQFQHSTTKISLGQAEISKMGNAVDNKEDSGRAGNPRWQNLLKPSTPSTQQPILGSVYSVDRRPQEVCAEGHCSLFIDKNSKQPTNTCTQFYCINRLN